MAQLSVESLLNSCITANGHRCPGQILGVRMSLRALSMIGIDDPKGDDRKSIMVFVEIDRCATDAIQYVTGCTIGKRTLKLLDHGKMAATFINLRSSVAVRILAREEARELAKKYFPEIDDKYRAQTEAYKIMSDDELFEAEYVTVDLPDSQKLPRESSVKVQCQQCGEYVQDHKEVCVEGKILCKACANGTYYRAIRLAGAATFSSSAKTF